MVIVSGFIANCSGLIHPSGYKLPFRDQIYNRIRFNGNNPCLLASEKISRGRRTWSFITKPYWPLLVRSVRSNRDQLSFNDEFQEKPFWLSLIEDSIWALRSLCSFLVGQPGQLKYIEWPSFQSTLKTATLTLVLVAALIIALASVDSVLCFLLALMLRKSSW
ncbi:hypothetical protein SLEP1_g33647 [Rubroshorea leprosula]|uniref:Preprotein translocase subunit SecE n=1 Tax=Rubroshorea leprosula TaxID=152421 RepID=A0AAV5KHA3_9ROSI|nr:hypothetical protein SLEP1_g33647 [Rubroshorea leprosula]